MKTMSKFSTQAIEAYNTIPNFNLTALGQKMNLEDIERTDEMRTDYYTEIFNSMDLTE